MYFERTYDMTTVLEAMCPLRFGCHQQKETYLPVSLRMFVVPSDLAVIFSKAYVAFSICASVIICCLPSCLYRVNLSILRPGDGGNQPFLLLENGNNVIFVLVLLSILEFL